MRVLIGRALLQKRGWSRERSRKANRANPTPLMLFAKSRPSHKLPRSLKIQMMTMMSRLAGLPGWPGWLYARPVPAWPDLPYPTLSRSEPLLA